MLGDRIRIHLTSGGSIETAIPDVEELDSDEILAALREQLDAELAWLVIGDAVVFPSRVSAIELL